MSNTELQQKLDHLQLQFDRLSFTHDCGRLENATLTAIVQELLDHAGLKINAEEEVQEALIEYVTENKEAQQNGGAV